MTLIFNQHPERVKRKFLRANRPKAERLLWSKLKGKQLLGYKFRRQYSVYYFVIDFYCARKKLAIEIDGDSHFHKDSQKYDNARQKMIENLGIKFLRFTNDEIYSNLDDVLHEICLALKEGE